MKRPRVLFLLHGTAASVEAVSVREFAKRLGDWTVDIAFRGASRFGALQSWHSTLHRLRPDVVYVVNTAFPGAVLAPFWRRVSGYRYVLDTGDAVYEMARRSGIGGGARLPWLRLFENT